MAHNSIITRLTCMSAAAGAAVLLVIGSAGASTAGGPSATGPSSGHALTRLVESGVQTPSSDPNPNPAAKIASGHSLTRLVESGVQTPSRPSVQTATPGRESRATGTVARQVALGALGGVVLAGAWTLAVRRRRTPHVA